jgi:hypothetical protein
MWKLFVFFLLGALQAMMAFSVQLGAVPLLGWPLGSAVSMTVASVVFLYALESAKDES